MTNPLAIPSEIKSFILTSIASVPHLEALLLLRRDPLIEWDAKMMAQRLYVSEKEAEDTLVDLSTAGFAAIKRNCISRYFYKPITPELKELLDRLVDIYSKNLIEVTHLIHAKVNKQARKFGDAFKW